MCILYCCNFYCFWSWQIGSTGAGSGRKQIALSVAGLLCISPFSLGSQVYQHLQCCQNLVKAKVEEFKACNS